MMMQQPQVDYERFFADLKVKAGALFAYFAVVRAAPFVIDAMVSVANK